MRLLLPLAGIAAVASGTANAQSNPDSETEIGEIIVTGTRASGRVALDSSAPVDVVSGKVIADTGFPDLGRALNFLQPSINFARAATTATAANTKPVTLRGLSPDQTLVLINGKRRHANAVLNVNNSIGRGSAGVGTGADGFAGFNPRNPTNESRNAWAAFLGSVPAEGGMTP